MELKTLLLKDLKPWPENPRTITKEEFEGLKQSLTTFGQQENLIVNKDMTIISGHQRYQAMQALGWEEAVCNLVDLDKHQEKKLNVIMNSTAISGKYDDLKLSEILEELKLDEDYEALRLNVLEPLDLSPTEVEEDEPPEVSQEPPVSKLGEIYQLGRHRLMCGDSTDKASVELLMDGAKADMVFTDPPYALFGNSTGVAGVADDKMVQPFFREIASNISRFSKSYSHSYICCDWHSWSVLTLCLSSRLSVKNMIVWDKKRGALGNLYRSQHELLAIAINATQQNKVSGNTANKRPVTDVNVWNIDREKDGTHNAQKPQELMTRAIRNSSDENDLVLDLFLGSGSTLIACEQTDRTCYGMELDPKYVDVIRKRYAKFIGKEEEWQEVTPLVDPQS